MPALNYIAVIVKTNKQKKSNHYIQQAQRVFNAIKGKKRVLMIFFFFLKKSFQLSE